MLVCEERGKLEYPEKKLSEQRREPATNSTHIWRRREDLNPGHIGGRRKSTLLEKEEPISRLLVENDLVIVVVGYWACWPDTGQHRSSAKILISR